MPNLHQLGRIASFASGDLIKISAHVSIYSEYYIPYTIFTINKISKKIMTSSRMQKNPTPPKEYINEDEQLTEEEEEQYKKKYTRIQNGRL